MPIWIGWLWPVADTWQAAGAPPISAGPASLARAALCPFHAGALRLDGTSSSCPVCRSRRPAPAAGTDQWTLGETDRVLVSTASLWNQLQSADDSRRTFRNGPMSWPGCRTALFRKVCLRWRQPRCALVLHPQAGLER